MKTCGFSLACLALSLILQAQSPATRPVAPGPEMSVADITLLLRNGVAEDRIRQMISVRGVAFTLSGQIAADLSGAGARQPLLDAIRNASHPAGDPASAPPRVLSTVTPVYPPLALQIGVSGKVLARILVGTDGIPKDVELMNSLGYGLDESALAATRQWRFEPAKKNGSPVEDTADAVVSFRSPQTPEQLKLGWIPGSLAYSQTFAAGSAPVLASGAAVAGFPEIANASVKLEFTLNAQGAVSAVRVLHAPNRGAAEKIAQTFAAWKFRPATKSGVAVEAHGRIRFMKGYGDPDSDTPLFQTSDLLNAERPTFETPAFLESLDAEFPKFHERGLDINELTQAFGDWSVRTYGARAELKSDVAAHEFDVLTSVHPATDESERLTRGDVRGRLKLYADLGTFATSRDLAPRATRTVSRDWHFQVDAHQRQEALPYLNAAFRSLLADPEGRLLLDNALRKHVAIVLVNDGSPAPRRAGQYTFSPPRVTLFRDALGPVRPEDEDLNEFRLLKVLTHELVHAIFDSATDTMSNEAIADAIAFRIVGRFPRFYQFQKSAIAAVDNAVVGHRGLSPGGSVLKDLARFGIDPPPPDSQFQDPPSGPPILTSENDDAFDLDAGPTAQPKINLVGKPAPPVVLDGEGGAKFRLEDMKGKVVVLDFWASWCGPCRSQMPAMAKLHAEAEKKGFSIVAIDDDSVPENAVKYLSENHYRWTNFHDGQGAARRPFGVTGIPTTVVIDRSGVVRGYFRGASPNFIHEIRTALAQAGVNNP